MKILLLILMLNVCFGQKIPDDAKHFYASVGICEATYHLLPKMKQHNRFLISVGTSLTIGFSKELFDAHRCNRNKRTGFDKLDLATDAWGILCWVPFRICLNDYRTNRKVTNQIVR